MQHKRLQKFLAVVAIAFGFLILAQYIYNSYFKRLPEFVLKDKISIQKWTCGVNGVCLDTNPKCPVPTIQEIVLPKFTLFEDKCQGQKFAKLEGDEVVISNPENMEISYRISTDLGGAHIDHGVKVHGECPEYGNKEIFYPTCGKQEMKVLSSKDSGLRIKFINESIIIKKGPYYNYISRNVANKKLLKERKNNFESYKRKPPNIVVHVLDCTSRAAFYRMLPKTVKYLESLEKSKKFKLYQFMRHNFANFQTIKNIPQIFGGFPVEPPVFSLCEGGMKCPEEKCEWLYPFFKKMKYVVSQHSDQDTWCPHHFPLIKRDEYYDHYYDLMLNLFGGYTSPFSKTENGEIFHLCGSEYGSHCMGSKFTFNYVYDSVKSFWKNYKDVPKFINIHQLEGHEPTYKILSLLEKDDDIIKLIDEIIHDENTIYILMADHGLVYGEPMIHKFAQYEMKNPLLNIIIPNNDLFPADILENLKHNQFKLTTHPDVYFTLKQLPFYFIKDSTVSYPKVHPQVPAARNIFLEKLRDRKCSEFGIVDSMCICIGIDKIELIDEIKTNAITFLNGKVYPKETTEKKNCAKFTKNNLRIQKIDNFISDGIEYYESILEIYGHKNAPRANLFRITMKKINGNLEFSALYRVDEFQKSKCELPKHLQNHMWCVCTN